MADRKLDRRDFLGIMAAGVSYPALMGMSEEGSHFATETDRIPIQESDSLAGQTHQGGIWDYRANPVNVHNPDLKETWNSAAKFAFDGYGGSHNPDSIAHAWIQAGVPSIQKPSSCTVDFGRPVAISKFVHYFYRFSGKDYRTDPMLVSSAFSSARAFRSDDGTKWTLAETWTKMPSKWPQILPFSQPFAAQHYKLEVSGLISGAQGIRTYEIESYTGPIILSTSAPESAKSGEVCNIHGRIVGSENPMMLAIALKASDDIQIVKGISKVDLTGSFDVSLIPNRIGSIPIVLELADLNESVIDTCETTLEVAPRFILSKVQINGGSVTGVVRNSGTTSQLVKIGCGASLFSVGLLLPDQSSIFRIADAPGTDGQQLVELRVEENSRIESRWAYFMRHASIARQGQMDNEQLNVLWTQSEGNLRLRLSSAASKEPIQTAIRIAIDDVPVSFSVSESDSEKAVLWGRHEDAWVECTMRPAGSSLRMSFRNVSEGLQQVSEASGILTVRIRPDDVTVRFMPGYVYSESPISELENVYGKRSLVLGAWLTPTRMVALETKRGTVGLVPDRDRCLMGIDQSDAVVKIRLDGNSKDVLLPVVAGDWFECFRYVVDKIYKFTEPKQFRPLVETVMGQAKYLTHNEDIWSKKMEVVTSFPKLDYVYSFYGLPYTIPALCAWYQMSGDPDALHRVRKCVRWLLDYPDVRITEGPAAGAFFSQYVSPEIKEQRLGSLTVPLLGIGGCDQANNRWLEPHASGAIAWALLHYYVADEKRDKQVLEVAKAALDWLLKIQNASGGWSYAYKPDGTSLTEEEDSGNIWNIWAFYRYGKLTGDQRYLAAANRAKNWFAEKFLSQPICRGYWEDVSGRDGKVGLSWEAYEFGLAANAFADMGENELAVKAARNAVCWIWTRVTDFREYFNSYGHAHEQWNWPPASYVAPMLGLAAQTAYRITGDEFFRNFAGAAKTTGWWIVREEPDGRVWPAKASRSDVGGGFWPIEGMQFVPMNEPLDLTFWTDWITAQQCTICLRWLVQETNLRTGGRLSVDPEFLTGNVLGKPGKVVLLPDDFKVKSPHSEINWLGYRNGSSRVLAVLNHGPSTKIEVDSREFHGVVPEILVTPDGKRWQELAGPQKLVDLIVPARGCVLLIWKSDSEISPATEASNEGAFLHTDHNDSIH